MATKSKQVIYQTTQADAERKANQMRGQYNLGYRDIGDIFPFIEQSLGYLLIRYPFGEDALEGFAAIYRGERLVVANSSKILSRERFTAAHEIGHHVFDFKEGSNDILIADQETGSFNRDNLAEFRADCFAAALLMPKDGVEEVLFELGIEKGALSHTDIVRMQLAFGVSYRAMVRRLSDMGRIAHDEADYLYNYFEETGEGLKRLFRRAQAPSTNLLDKWNQVWVPTRYLRCLEANYESRLVSYPTLEKILAVAKMRPEEWEFEPRPEVEVEKEEDIDALIEELSHEV